MRLLRHLSFLARLTAGQTRITWRRIFRRSLAPGWTMGEERLHGMIQAFARGTVRWGFDWARSVESAAALLSPYARRVGFEPIALGGGEATRAVPKDGGGSPARVLYLHGGGFCFGSVRLYREIVARLALACDGAAIAPEYRLAPEHPFPAAQQDCLAAYRALLDETAVEPARLVVAGDSAGGGLVLSTLLAARDAGLPLPAGAVLFSPWVDPWGDDPSMTTNEPTDVLTLEFARLCREAAFADDQREDPRAAPLHGDLRGLPPILLQVGSLEMLLDQNRALHRRLAAAGVEVDYQERPLLFHSFQNLGSQVRRADAAVLDAERWIVDRLRAAE